MTDPKLALALVVFAAATGLRFIGQIGEASWTSVATAVVWAYVTGHVGAVLASGWALAKRADVKAKRKSSMPPMRNPAPGPGVLCVKSEA